MAIFGFKGPEYIKGAEPGQFYNTVTKELSDELTCANMFVDTVYAVNKRRDIGDDYQGEFTSNLAALEHLEAEGLNPKDYEVKDASYFYDEFRHNQWLEIKDTDSFQLDHATKKDSKFGTVGAVACDKNGNIAAATSTGGMTNKKWGRVGDSPMIGSGNYANNKTCAVSCTGSGEFFIRAVVAYDVSCLMEFKDLSLEEASQEVVHKRLPKIKGDGGLIAVDTNGNIAMPFNTEGMYRASKSSLGKEEISIYK